MYTTKGPQLLPGGVLLESHDHDLKRHGRLWPDMQTKFIRLLTKSRLQHHSSNTYKICSISEFHRKGARAQTRRGNDTILGTTSRRALLAGFSAVFEIWSVHTFLSRPIVDFSARADEDRSPLHGIEGAPANAVLQGLPFTTRLVRPRMGLVESEDELEEVLTVKLKLLRPKASAFSVFINLPMASEQTPINCSEYAGSFFHEPRRVKKPEFELQETTFRIGIGDVIKELGLKDQQNIIVTFVPRGVDKDLPVILESFNIYLE